MIRVPLRLSQFGQTEIEHLHHAVRFDLNIAGLQIAVNDALFVGGLQRFRQCVAIARTSPTGSAPC